MSRFERLLKSTVGDHPVLSWLASSAAVLCGIQYFLPQANLVGSIMVSGLVPILTFLVWCPWPPPPWATETVTMETKK